MLHHRSNAKSALVQISERCSRISIDTVVTAEPSSEFPVVHTRLCSYAELYQLVTALVSALLQHGIQPGDRVASYSSNCIVSLRTFTPGYDSQHHFMIYILRKMWQLALLQRLLVVSGSVPPPTSDQKAFWNGKKWQT